MSYPVPFSEIKSIALRHGASDCGVVRAEKLAEYARFQACSSGAPSGLAYLGRSSALREDIRRWFPPARSVLVCAFQYWRSGLDYAAALAKAGEPMARLQNMGHKPRHKFIAGVKVRGLRPKISRYALLPDYHEIIKGRLRLMLADIKTAYAGTEGKLFTDTSPVMEKELGRLAGLGFRGKNTLLISKELGSWFFIGGLALSLDAGQGNSSGTQELGEDGAGPGCDSCGKCAAACPTGALKVPGILDAELCISYWSTQSKTAPPEEVINQSGGYIYGCDICQEVCPYNAETSDKVLLHKFSESKKCC